VTKWEEPQERILKREKTLREISIYSNPSAAWGVPDFVLLVFKIALSYAEVYDGVFLLFVIGSSLNPDPVKRDNL
jgi:hypothetical protein